ncbi:VolA/Pla-1 family phospholipase [Alteromonas halophila]|uniref:Lipase n=1 Tax=Alteromonas halophila TaxID=516698 RepID=A0A918JLD9_9ALTE|nr:VolA/Pla-1 family phospholipase [Alteromonas halophila]GGW88195.1 lipase [Alteromonas halophila]
MRKLLLSSSVAVALGLAGCGGSETLDDVQAETPVEAPLSRVVFDPGAGNVNIPNDILMLPGDDGFFDYTLNIPVADPTDFGDPQNALNVLDGWSTQHPFQIEISTAAGVSLDASTLASGVHLFEATHGLDIRDPDCAQAEIPSSGCKVGDKLTYGVDYVANLAGPDTINVVPLKPLKPAQGYMLVVTNDLQDSEGNGVEGSTTWDLVSQDINTNPLSTESQLLVQQLVNSLIAPVVDAGVSRDSISYAAAFTTQSTSIALDTIKKVMVSEYAARAGAGDPTAGQALPAIVARTPDAAPNAMEALGLVNQQAVDGAVEQGIAALPPQAEPLIPAIRATDFSALQTCDGLLGTASGQLAGVWGQLNDFAVGISEGILQQAGPLCAASRFEGEISLPYFLGVPSAENSLAPVNTFWQAACDSGVVLNQASDEVLASATPGPNNEMCQQLGLADLRVNGEKLDPARNVTRFNPYPQPTGGNMGKETLDVQITVPNAMVSSALGFPIEKPEAGWPVVILSHGITSRKEDMLAITGTLSLAGIATVAIDHPLHGSRGYDLDGDGTDDLNATFVSATHYMNLGNLPTARDNLRQSVSDFMGLRLGLNAVVDTTDSQAVDFDMSRVSVMGVSLGAMTVGNVSAVANTSMGGDLAALDGLFAVQQASLESPGGGAAQFLLESPSFGPLIKGLLLTESSPEFRALLEAQFGSTDVTEEELAEAVGLFLDNASEEQMATINGTFAQFAFAAQTVLDAGDPNNYAKTLGETTPVHMMTVVGDGSEQNPPDQVIPVSTSLPLAGQMPYAGIVGLQQVTTTQTGDPVSGHVLFNSGAHASSLSPNASPAVTEEMQREVAGYIGSSATVLPITNEDVVAN